MKFLTLLLTKKEGGAKTYPTSKTSILKLLLDNAVTLNS